MIIRNLIGFRLLRQQISLGVKHIRQPFIIGRMFKKKFEAKEETFKPRPETYSANGENTEPKKDKQKQQLENKEQFRAEAEYDFFTRQKEIELNRDFRKIREQVEFIPAEIGKGGFEEILYWSEFAKTPEQIISITKLFNRVDLPREISDPVRFRTFVDKVNKTVYLSSNINTIQQFATFGDRYRLTEDLFWKKVEEKTIRFNPSTPEQTKDTIEIAFLMSRMGKGEVLYSSLINLFKNSTLTPMDLAKLLSVYANTESGQKQWVGKLKKELIENFDAVPLDLFVELFEVFKKLKDLTSAETEAIEKKIEQNIENFEFVQLCMSSSFFQHGKKPQAFWARVQNRLTKILPSQKNPQVLICLLEVLSSYSISTQFVRNHVIPLLRHKNSAIVYEYPPHILSSISKILYIYQLEKETQDIEERIQTIIMRQYNNLKNVEVENLIKVIKDYSITRVGSRELYIFLEEVALALFEEIKEDRQHLTTLLAVYEKSELCSSEFLQKLSSNL